MADPLSWVLQKIKQINDFIWHTSISDISRGKSFVIRQLRIIVLAARGFMNDRVQLRASSLTLYTMLSIIPFVAIAFGIAKGFALDQKLQELLVNEFQTQPEVLTWILNQANSAIQATSGGYIAGIGLIILIWSVMSLLDQIESSFNHIWQIECFKTMVAQVYRLSCHHDLCSCIPDPFKQYYCFCKYGIDQILLQGPRYWSSSNL